MAFQKDKITLVENAIIQHGPLSQRIYLMKIGNASPHAILGSLERLAHEYGYTKIFAKIPQSVVVPFLRTGYQIESRVPRFFRSTETAFFLGFYFTADRQVITNPILLDDVLELAQQKAILSPPLHTVPLGFTIRNCTSEDVGEMSAIYSNVFSSYPFPIDDPAYLLDTMQTHVKYFGVEHKGKLVALSSSEMDTYNGNAEMSDFATLSAWQGRGLALCLLSYMEQAMRHSGITTTYTIARALSTGMNITFAKMGYQFGGRLINNTNIAGSIESMNVWYKSLDGKET